MARTERTTKKLAQRIDLNYFQRPSPLRTWRFMVGLAAPLLAAVWLCAFAVGRNNRPYSSGKMSAAHAVLTQRCADCHVSQAGALLRTTTPDTACLSCHDGPLHHDQQVFTPTCASCHLEHQGRRMRLASTSDASCTRCHAQLEVRSGAPATTYARAISKFNQADHPEFRAVRPDSADPGTIVFLHSVHMKAGLLGPGGKQNPVQMVCADCHRTPAAPARAWPYATPQAQNPAPRKVDLLSAAPTRAYMTPVAYATGCAACHGLQFDPRVPDQVPHDTTDREFVLHPAQVIDKLLREKYTQYLSQRPGLFREPSAWILQLPGGGIAPGGNTPALTGVALRVAEAERILWGKTCKQCHQLTFSPGAALPKVVTSSITPVWMPHARFDHDAHQMLTCLSCHTGAAAKSDNAPRDAATRETPAALLPGIKSCAQCHRPGSEAAESRCFECHRYHDWTRRNEVQGKLTITGKAHPAITSASESPATSSGGTN